MKTGSQAEVLVIEPPEPEGPDVARRGGWRPGMGPCVVNDLFRCGVGYLLMSGVDVAFGPGDAFASEPPDDLSRYKGVFIAVHDLPRLRDRLRDFEGVAEFEYQSPGQSACFRHRSGSPLLMAFGWAGDTVYYTFPNIDKFIIEADLAVYSNALERRLKARSDRALLDDLLQRMLRLNRADWTDVMSYAARSVLAAWEATGDERCLDYVEWLFDSAAATIYHEDDHVKLRANRAGTPIDFGVTLSLDSLVNFHRIRPKERYLEILRNELTRALRKENYRITDSWAPFPKGVHGRVAVTAFFDEFSRIEDDFLRYCRAGESALYDEKTGLWRYFVKHGRTCPHFPGHGCALSLLHLPIILDFYPKDRPGYETMVEMYRRLARGVARYQDDRGFWRTILDVPGSLERTDHTALFLYSFLRGHRMGLLEDEFRERGLQAWDWLKTRTFQGGAFGVLGGISHSYTYSYYLLRPIFYNYAAAPPVCNLLAASEVLRQSERNGER